MMNLYSFAEKKNIYIHDYWRIFLGYFYIFLLVTNDVYAYRPCLEFLNIFLTYVVDNKCHYMGFFFSSIIDDVCRTGVLSILVNDTIITSSTDIATLIKPHI